MALMGKTLKLHWRAFLTVANAGDSIWCFWTGRYGWGVVTAVVAALLLFAILRTEKASS